MLDVAGGEAVMTLPKNVDLPCTICGDLVTTFEHNENPVCINCLTDYDDEVYEVRN